MARNGAERHSVYTVLCKIGFSLSALAFSSSGSAATIEAPEKARIAEDEISGLMEPRDEDLPALEWESPLPLDSEEQAVGFYSDGRLVNANHVDAEGVGYVRLFSSRKRYFGSDDLVSLIEAAAVYLNAKGPRRRKDSGWRPLKEEGRRSIWSFQP